MKIHVGVVETFRKKERQDEIHFTTKIDGFLSFIPCWMLMYFFVFKKISPYVWPNSGFWCYVFPTLWITLLGQVLTTILWPNLTPMHNLFPMGKANKYYNCAKFFWNKKWWNGDYFTLKNLSPFYNHFTFIWVLVRNLIQFAHPWIRLQI
jgi:hypothetical protein